MLGVSSGKPCGGADSYTQKVNGWVEPNHPPRARRINKGGEDNETKTKP